MIRRDALRWNGWGWLGESMGFSQRREAWLLEALGRELGRPLVRAAEPASLETLRLPPSKLAPEILAALRRACGEDSVRTSTLERVSHALGRSLPDLLRLREADVSVGPDAVVYPPDEGAVAAVLRVASRESLAVVPVGGGTSVVGGIEPRLAPGQAGAIALDTTRMDALLRLDEESGLATFQAGIDGPDLERSLAARGYTLGHFPQSFELSTLGGWIATRSSGQLSDRYGGIEELLVSVRVVTPEGVLRTLEVPRSATGPDLNALVLGSEGTLGVVVEATVRVRPRAEVSAVRGLLLHGFEDGLALVREARRAELPLSMVRLSDADQTALFELMRRDPARRFDPSRLALALAARCGWGRGRCVLLYGAEGARREVRRTLGRLRSLGLRRRALPIGSAPGRAWLRDRFRTPYLRDWLLDHGAAVDTLETALPWARVAEGHDRIRRALRAALERHAEGGAVMGHLSHSYPDGASLYFTLVYALDATAAVSQWQEIKREATDAVVAAGGTLSHHHGIGSDHLGWMTDEKGAVGLEALRAACRSLDPQGIMNPGKLLP
ncbi:MAG: FAD-binding oxidoreductase [Myxococcota bacterium]